MSAENQDAKCRCDFAYAHLILRLWVGLRLFMAGVDKFRAGNGPTTTFNFENYHKKSDQIATLMSTNSFLPEWACKAYATSIGFALLLVGVWVALGILTELGLFAAGLVFLSLGFGLAALPDDMELTANIGIGIIITAMALTTAKHKNLSLDGLLRKKGE